MATIIPNLNRLDNLDLKIVRSGGTTYVGQAKIGSGDGDAVWQILRIVTTGQDSELEWADSNDLFDNIWNNRASLSYG